jgi:hypothetical protein
MIEDEINKFFRNILKNIGLYDRKVYYNKIMYKKRGAEIKKQSCCSLFCDANVAGSTGK